jgi:hypothetical protein
MIHETALDDRATDAQRRMLFAMWKQAGIVDRATRLRVTSVMLAKLVESSCALSRRDASALIDALMTGPPEDLF